MIEMIDWDYWGLWLAIFTPAMVIMVTISRAWERLIDKLDDIAIQLRDIEDQIRKNGTI